MLSIDFAGPLTVTRTQSKQFLIGVEHLSGWPVAVVLSSSGLNCPGVIQFLKKEKLTPTSVPMFLTSSNDASFNSAPVKDYANINVMKWKFTTA